jgi:hypothetical protein
MKLNSFLLKLESKYENKVSPFLDSIRDNMYDILSCENIDFETISLTFEIAKRCFNKNIKQTFGCSLYIASKFLEINPLNVKSIKYMFGIDKKVLLKLEIDFLVRLNFFVLYPTPYKFLLNYIKKNSSKKEKKIILLLQNVLVNSKYCDFLPSEIASAIYYLVINTDVNINTKIKKCIDYLMEDSEYSFNNYEEPIIVDKEKVQIKYIRRNYYPVEYTRNKILGKGSYGIVYSGQLKNGENVAIKELFQENNFTGLHPGVIRELTLIQELEHENIVKILNIFHENGNMYIIMEKMQTDLEKAINIYYFDLQDIMRQIISTVYYLHSNNIWHRDLKPQNILYDCKSKKIKITDFNISCFEPSKNTKRTNDVCTLDYRAPELLLKNDIYGSEIDMWSIGCIMAQLIHSKCFFEGETDVSLLKTIFETLGKNKTKEFEMINKKTFSYYFPELEEDGVDLLYKLLNVTPSKRISAKEALNHPYLN